MKPTKRIKQPPKKRVSYPAITQEQFLNKCFRLKKDSSYKKYNNYVKEYFTAFFKEHPETCRSFDLLKNLVGYQIKRVKTELTPKETKNYKALKYYNETGRVKLEMFHKDSRTIFYEAFMDGK